MQRKILIASVLVPLEANESATVDFPNETEFQDPVVSVVRYNQGQVEILLVEEFAIMGPEDVTGDIPPEYLGLEEKAGEVDE